MPTESISDHARPNAGRIYDYMLGGYHNFEVDRQASDQITKLLPSLPKIARLQRWCLQDIALELTERRGFDIIVDFASGLPTNDHLHTLVPKDTTIIYSDSDPITVEYARDILKQTPNVYYFQADARHPEELLQLPEVQKILNGRRKVGLSMWGVAGFLNDEGLANAAKYLYDWCEAGSCWAFQAQGGGGNPDDPAGLQALKIYEQTGTPFYVRPMEKYLELLKPWQPVAPGFISLLEWHGFDQSVIHQEDLQIFGMGAANYGAYLVK